MTVASQTTLVLAILIGLMAVAVGVGGFSDPRRWTEMLDELDRSPGLVLAMAVVAYGFGAVVVAVHNLWTDPLAVIVTLFGWGSLVEGTLLLAAPGFYLRLVRRVVASSRIWAGFALLLGLFLVAAGLAARVEPALVIV